MRANAVPVNGQLPAMTQQDTHDTGQNGTTTAISPLYLIRLTHTHETFRQPELEAIATSLNINLKIVEYQPNSPFCIVQLQPQTSSTLKTPDQHHALARTFASNSILAKSIHELYATASDYPTLHSQIKALPLETWMAYQEVSFKFSIDAFFGKRSTSEQRSIIESFSYLPFNGKIVMKKPNQEFVVSEEWELLTPEEHSTLNQGCGSTIPRADKADQDDSIVGTIEVPEPRKPKRLFFGRYIGGTKRDLIDKHDLKKRPYISTTSMDAELALVTANLALAGHGKLFLDPFVGTGGFMVAAAELGAVTLGSDIDGRSFRGKGKGLDKGVGKNFVRYGLQDRFGDCLTSDLTNSPFRWPGKVSGLKSSRWLDGIICDPPYGIREGLKVLGRRIQDADTPPSDLGVENESSIATRRTVHDGPYFVDGIPSHTLPDFVAPKRPYSFNRMLDDILEFAARTLVDGGRLAFWMPCANEAMEEEFPIPQHAMLELKHVCVQSFNKWSRRLLVYQRVVGDLPDDFSDVSDSSLKAVTGTKADDLNQFRRRYFQGFISADAQSPRNDNG